MRPYASEVMDTVTDLVFKTQANLYTMDDVFRQNEDVMSGDITNGCGLAPRLQKFVIWGIFGEKVSEPDFVLFR